MKRKRNQKARDSTISTHAARSALVRAVKIWYDAKTRSERQLPLLNDDLLFAAASKYFGRRAYRTAK